MSDITFQGSDTFLSDVFVSVCLILFSGFFVTFGFLLGGPNWKCPRPAAGVQNSIIKDSG